MNSNRIQSIHSGFWNQNLRRRGQTGTFLFQNHSSVSKRQNESGTKIFRIRHESGKISSSVNLVEENWAIIFRFLLMQMWRLPFQGVTLKKKTTVPLQTTRKATNPRFYPVLPLSATLMPCFTLVRILLHLIFSSPVSCQKCSWAGISSLVQPDSYRSRVHGENR